MECTISTYLEYMFRIRTSFWMLHITRKDFKHSHWGDSRELQRECFTKTSILFNVLHQNYDLFFWSHLFHQGEPSVTFLVFRKERTIWTYLEYILEIRDSFGMLHMTRKGFKHSHWDAPRGLKSQWLTMTSIRFPNKTMTYFVDHISFIRESIL